LLPAKTSESVLATHNYGTKATPKQAAENGRFCTAHGCHRSCYTEVDWVIVSKNRAVDLK
jgi:hypothetical protein